MKRTLWTITGEHYDTGEKYGPITTFDYPDREFLLTIATKWSNGESGQGDYYTAVKLTVEKVDVEVSSTNG